MITEDYVSFEVAKLLKEKGFDEPCRVFYKDPQAGLYEFKNAPKAYKDKLFEPCFLAPSLYMAMKWLREVHNLCIAPYAAAYRYGFTIDKADTGSNLGNETDFYPIEVFETYEQAVEAAIKYSLKNLL